MNSHPSGWGVRPERLSLAGDEAQVWRAELDQPAEVRRGLRSLLTPLELERASRFRFEKDRNHFAVARGLLRTMLGEYLGLPPARLRFSYQTYGKPALAEEFAESGLRFNVSHSHGLALFAFTRRREVGLDVEYMREEFAGESVAEHFFSPAEVRALRALPPGRRVQGFFNCWTRKEAYVKARGTGLSFPLAAFSVSLAPGEPAALLGVRGDPGETSRWSLRALEPGTGYAAAVAVEGGGWRLRRWRWEA